MVWSPPNVDRCLPNLLRSPPNILCSLLNVDRSPPKIDWSPTIADWSPTKIEGSPPIADWSPPNVDSSPPIDVPSPTIVVCKARVPQFSRYVEQNGREMVTVGSLIGVNDRHPPAAPPKKAKKPAVFRKNAAFSYRRKSSNAPPRSVCTSRSISARVGCQPVAAKSSYLSASTLAMIGRLCAHL